MSSKITELPDRIIPIKNADKKFHESWTKNRNILNIPHPYVFLAIGRPNCGKSTLILNIIVRADPKFKRIYLIHCDIENTKEYDELGDIIRLDEFPSPESWPNDGKKTLVIVDDVELKSKSKEQLKNLDRMCSYCSTHKNLSVIITSQDSFNIPSNIRRVCNVLNLWRPKDMDSMATISRKSGMKSKQLRAIFEQLMPNFRDSLMIDMTLYSPAPLRKNGYEVITQTSEGDESRKINLTMDKFEID